MNKKPKAKRNFCVGGFLGHIRNGDVKAHLVTVRVRVKCRARQGASWAPGFCLRAGDQTSVQKNHSSNAVMVPGLMNITQAKKAVVANCTSDTFQCAETSKAENFSPKRDLTGSHQFTFITWVRQFCFCCFFFFPLLTDGFSKASQGTNCYP